MKVLLIALISSIFCSLTSAQLPGAQLNNQWFKDGKALIESKLKLKPIQQGGKSVILFVGDGMSITTTTASRIYKGQKNGKQGEESKLAWDNFPYTGLSKTYNTDHQVSDSSSTATSFLCGVKTNTGIVGLNQNSVRGNCAASKNKEVMTILELARQANLSVGVVSTARVTHATPATTYAHTPERDWEAFVPEPDKSDGCIDIATQLINSQKANGGINVMLGGGRQSFIPNTESDVEYPNKKGDRLDGRNVIQEWQNLKFPNSAYVWNLSAFNAIDPQKTDYLFGLFEPGHMQFEIDRNKGPGGEPSIVDMTKKAIQILQKNSNGYFLMVEGARIDHGHHEGVALKALVETVTMDEAVEAANSMTKVDNTLIVVTADHGHTISMGGYQKKGNPILGLTDDRDIYDKPYLTLNYANGPGGWDDDKPRPNLTGVDYNDPHFLQQALAHLRKETHDGTDVGIYARGPFSYLYAGVVEQSFIFHPMAKALCLDPAAKGQQKCETVNSAINLSYFTCLTFLISLLAILFQ